MATGNGVQTAVRISSETAKRLDAAAKAMEEKTPGLKMSRSDVMRIAIENGLGSMSAKKTAKKVTKKVAKKTAKA